MAASTASTQQAGGGAEVAPSSNASIVASIADGAAAAVAAGGIEPPVMASVLGLLRSGLSQGGLGTAIEILTRQQQGLPVPPASSSDPQHVQEAWMLVNTLGRAQGGPASVLALLLQLKNARDAHQQPSSTSRSAAAGHGPEVGAGAGAAAGHKNGHAHSAETDGKLGLLDDAPAPPGAEHLSIPHVPDPAAASSSSSKAASLSDAREPRANAMSASRSGGAASTSEASGSTGAGGADIVDVPPPSWEESQQQQRLQDNSRVGDEGAIDGDRRESAQGLVSLGTSQTVSDEVAGAGASGGRTGTSAAAAGDESPLPVVGDASLAGADAAAATGRRRGRKRKDAAGVVTDGPHIKARLEQDELQRKNSHKEVERRRRHAINEAIDSLATIVPGCEAKTTNKGSIITQAVAYIHDLKNNEASNIEKWTLEKLLMDQALDDARNEAERAIRENDRLREALERAGIDVDLVAGDIDLSTGGDAQQQQQQQQPQPPGPALTPGRLQEPNTQKHHHQLQLVTRGTGTGMNGGHRGIDHGEEDGIVEAAVEAQLADVVAGGAGSSSTTAPTTTNMAPTAADVPTPPADASSGSGIGGKREAHALPDTPTRSAKRAKT